MKHSEFDRENNETESLEVICELFIKLLRRSKKKINVLIFYTHDLENFKTNKNRINI